MSKFKAGDKVVFHPGKGKYNARDGELATVGVAPRPPERLPDRGEYVWIKWNMEISQQNDGYYSDYLFEFSGPVPLSDAEYQEILEGEAIYERIQAGG